MKLRTSFFNWTALKKDITRFAPAWGLYTIFQLLFVLLMWDGEGSAALFMNNASEIMAFMGVLNFVYAALCVLMLFGDLFSPKLCNALHAMPLRREGWFLTHCVAGLSFSIVPNLLGASLAAVLLQEYCYGAFLWLAIACLQFLFFFGIGTFCAMCAGNRLGAMAMYALGNFFSVLVSWLAITFYEPVLYGIELNQSHFARLSPVVRFTDSAYIQTHYDNMYSVTVFDGFVPEDWRFLFVAAGVGAVLLALALLIYRKRRLETAGDFISTKPAAPVFLILYTLCVGAVMYFIAEITSESLRYVFLVIGLGIGFFTGCMLLERKVRVFQKKNWLAFGGLVLAFFLSITLTVVDPIGITRYVPEADDVESVQFSPYGNRHYLRNEYTLTEQKDIEVILDVHRYALKNRYIYENYSNVYLVYKLKNGTTVSRVYKLETTSDAAQALRPYYSSPAYVLGTDNIPRLLENLNILEFYPSDSQYPYVAIGKPDWVNPENKEKYGSDKEPVIYATEGSFNDNEVAAGLINALAQDCKEGNMAQNWDYHIGYGYIGNVTFQYQQSYYNTYYMDINIFEDCTHTVAYLRSLEAN